MYIVLRNANASYNSLTFALHSPCLSSHKYVVYDLALNSVQWRSQDIADARAQHGHTTFVRTSAQSVEAFRGVWGHPPPKKFRNFTASQLVLRPYTVAKCKSDERMQLVIHIAILHRSISRQFSARFVINNATISALHWWGTATSC